jgi:hypothetical protein
MRKVLGQEPAADTGPTERRLREMLVRNGRQFMQMMESLEAKAGRDRKLAEAKDAAEKEVADVRAENAQLKAEVDRLETEAGTRGDDAGSARAEALIDRIMADLPDE